MKPKMKARFIQRKKRKFTGNIYTRKKESTESELLVAEKSAISSENSSSEENSNADKQTPTPSVSSLSSSAK